MEAFGWGLLLYGGAVLGIGLLVGYRFGSAERAVHPTTFGDLGRAYPRDYPPPPPPPDAYLGEPKPTTRRSTPSDAPPSL